MTRSAREWAELAVAPLIRFRAEVWKALNDVKEETDGREKLSWPDLVRRWRPEEEDTKTVEARWRRGLDTDSLDVDIMDVGEALAALYTVRDRLPVGSAPRVRRFLYEEHEPADRIVSLLYPARVAGQDLCGLGGVWRLVHQRSDNRGFLAWRVIITAAREPSDGPGAWVRMETQIDQRTGSTTPIVNGAVHSAGGIFYLIGVDHEHHPTIASFDLPRGKYPNDSFDQAHGLVQRVGGRGLCAARAVISRVSTTDDAPIGSFTHDGALERGLTNLASDIALIRDEPEPAYLLPIAQSLGG